MQRIKLVGPYFENLRIQTFSRRKIALAMQIGGLPQHQRRIFNGELVVAAHVIPRQADAPAEVINLGRSVKFTSIRHYKNVFFQKILRKLCLRTVQKWEDGFFRLIAAPHTRCAAPHRKFHLPAARACLN